VPAGGQGPFYDPRPVSSLVSLPGWGARRVPSDAREAIKQILQIHSLHLTHPPLTSWLLPKLESRSE
jgi:hypothetical protein